MQRLHWDEVQPHLKAFPMPDAPEIIEGETTAWAVEKLAEAAIRRHRVVPGANANYDAYVPLMAQLLGSLRAMAVYKVFALRGGQIYKITKDFGEVLYGLKADVPPTVLSWDDKIYCIEFPDGMEFDLGDGDTGRNAYVGMFKDGETMVMNVTVPIYRNGEFQGQDNLKLNLDETTTLVEALRTSRYMTTLGNPSGIGENIMSYIVNCMLYIQSDGQPDLRFLKPVRKPSNIKDLKRWLKNEHARIPYPVVLVGFDYKKPKEYLVGEAHVKAHRRWQRCGPKLSRVKLTWVKDHTRHYQKDDEV